MTQTLPAGNDLRGEWRSGWPLVVAATAGMSLAALSTASFGVMLAPIEQDLGWSRAEISVGPMLISLLVVLAGTAAGFAIDRLGPRIIAVLAAALYCAAIAGMSLISAPWMWWALWAMIGLASAALPTVCVSPISKAFNSGRGLALAVVLSGSGISSFLVPNLANYMVEHYGWRTAYQGLGLVWALAAIPLFALFLRNPGPAPLAAGAASGEAPSAPVLTGYTAREGFRAPAFYKLIFAYFLSVGASVALLLNLVPVLRSTGLTPATAAAVAGLVGIATIAGRVVSGWLIDRMNASGILSAATLGLIALPAALLAAPGSVPVAMAAVIAFGLLGGATAPGMAYLVGKHLGARSFGTFYATMNVGSSIGLGLGPLLANLAYDRVHSYVPTMWAAMPLLALAALLYASLGKYPEFAGEAGGGDRLPDVPRQR